MKQPEMIPLIDLNKIKEDERIDIIGKTAVHGKKQVAFIVEDLAKADRYIKKLRQKYPTIDIRDRFLGPIGNVITVKVGPPKVEPEIN